MAILKAKGMRESHCILIHFAVDEGKPVQASAGSLQVLFILNVATGELPQVGSLQNRSQFQNHNLQMQI